MPFASRRWRWKGNPQSLMRTYEIEESIFEFEMSPQKIAFLRMRQSFTYQTSITLTRGKVVTLDIGSIDLLSTEHGSDDFRGTENDPAADLNHASLLALFVNLSVKQPRIQHPPGCRAWPPASLSVWRRFGRTVVGNECRDVSWQLIAGEQWRAPVRACFEGR